MLQYDAFEPIPGVHINGRQTMGENLADLAGLSIAWRAYHLALGDQKAPVGDGFTGDQRFFLSFAQAWRIKVREGALREALLSDEHSPADFRVLGAVRNLNAWYAAFGVQPGDRYYLRPEARVRLW